MGLVAIENFSINLCFKHVELMIIINQLKKVLPKVSYKNKMLHSITNKNVIQRYKTNKRI